MTKNSDVANPLEFSPISLPQMEQVEALRLAYGNTLYLYTFPSLYEWQEDEGYEICLCNDAFVVKNGVLGDNAYLFPCGTDEKKRELIDSLIEKENPVFYSMTDEDKTFLENEYPGQFAFEECRDDFIYIYDKSEQIELKGQAYKRLRHKVNRGRDAATQWKTEPLTDDNIARALDINRQWAESYEADGLADIRAAEAALNHFSELSMWGLIFQANGKDTAYVAGAFITPEIFDLSFCKVLDKRCGFFVKWKMYCELPSEVKTVDSEEDLGIKGLREHKLQRQPKELIRIWKGSFIK